MSENQISLYVGTYAKYNNGSIFGKWLKLSDYSDASEFFEACKELHSDEEDAEYMFQDVENVPDHLYSEYMGEHEINRLIEYNKVLELIENWGDSEWLTAYNTYCDSMNYMDDFIYNFDDDFFDTHFNNQPMEAAKRASFGNINWSHDYITFDGYGNLKSIDSIEDYIDKDAVMKDILENLDKYQ